MFIDGSRKITQEYYLSVLGEGGEEKFQEVSDEIDKNIKDQQDEFEAKKNKTYSMLSPLEQMLLSLDASLNNARHYHESKRYEHLRNMQFRDYVRQTYGIDY